MVNKSQIIVLLGCLIGGDFCISVHCFSNCPFSVSWNSHPSDVFTCAVTPSFCSDSEYRSFDGSCNNLLNPTAGMANTRYERLVPAKYADGIHLPPVSVTKYPLPNARQISLAAFGEDDIYDPKISVANMQWGQIVSHDISLQAAEYAPKNCCNKKRSKRCLPIYVSNNDPVYGPAQKTCLSFARTTTDHDVHCEGFTHSTAQQLTTVTSFLDLSLVYGNSLKESTEVREFQCGRLLTRYKNGQEFMPLTNNQSDPHKILYKSGDSRASFIPGTAVGHTILLREHNRLAGILQSLNPLYSDEKIFQEARKINIAQYQYITYYEWLPIFIGPKAAYDFGLVYNPTADGFINDYNPNISPAALNAFATAAFRYAHSQIQGVVKLLSHRGLTTLRLSDWFNRPGIIEEEDYFDAYIRGMVTQPQHNTDSHYDKEIKHYLNRNNDDIGNDLRAFDIQRNRDHGIASYNDFRVQCGLTRAWSWEGYSDVISPQNIMKLKTLYSCYEDVELVVGGSLEMHVPGSIVGPTFRYIIIEQFKRLRRGDRFFFERYDPQTGFSFQQLKEIRKVSFSRLLCDNTKNLGGIQPFAFWTADNMNPFGSCHNIPAVDYTQWQNYY